MLVDGKRIFSCNTPASRVAGKSITTIEGLANGETLHPVQQAFLDEGGVPVRLLHAGHDHGDGRAARAHKPNPTDERDLRRDEREPLPLLRLRNITNAVQPGRGEGEQVTANAERCHERLEEPLEDPDQIIEPVGYDFGFSRADVRAGAGGGAAHLTAARRWRHQTQPQQTAAAAVAGTRRRTGPADQPRGAAAHRQGRHHHRHDRQGRSAARGSRAQITQAAAEELRVPVEQVRLIMADTALVPDDGMTAGSRTTPSTLPAVRKACAAARQLLRGSCREQWTSTRQVEISDGRSGRAAITYADLAAEAAELFKQAGAATTCSVTPVERVEGARHRRRRGPTARPRHRRAHVSRPTSSRPGMLYGKVLRPPSYGAKLTDDRSRAGQGDGGRRRRARWGVRRRRRAEHARREARDRGAGEDREVGIRAAPAERERCSSTSANTPRAACRRTRTRSESAAASR